MKTKDIKAGTQYADCKGNLVVPVEPVEAMYIMDDGVAKRISPNTATDPWGSCDIRPRRSGVSTRSYGPTPGIRCKRWTPDENGDPIEGSDCDYVVEPRDIKGTWLEYMVLHGASVRQEAQKRSWENQLKAFNAALTDKLTAFFGEKSASTFRFWVGDKYNKGFVPTELGGAQIQIIISNRDQFAWLIDKLGGLSDHEMATNIHDLLPESADPDSDYDDDEFV
jgi:hypothetical protein